MRKTWIKILSFAILICSLSACTEESTSSGNVSQNESQAISEIVEASSEQASEVLSEIIEESREEESIEKLLEGKKIIGYDVKYPAGDYFPAEMGTIEIDSILLSAFDKYESDEMFCVLIRANSKYEDLKQSVVYEGETYAELYAKRENSDEDAAKFSAVAKLYAAECEKNDIEFFKNSGVIVAEFEGEEDGFIVFSTEKQLKELKVSSEQSFNAYLDTPNKLGEGKFEFENFSSLLEEK